MDPRGDDRHPVSRDRARLHPARARGPASRNDGPGAPDRADLPGRGPADGGHGGPVLPHGVLVHRGDDRDVRPDGGVPRADDRGDPRPPLPGAARPRAVRPRGGAITREEAEDWLSEGGKSGFAGDPAPRASREISGLRMYPVGKDVVIEGRLGRRSPCACSPSRSGAGRSLHEAFLELAGSASEHPPAFPRRSFPSRSVRGHRPAGRASSAGSPAPR